MAADRRPDRHAFFHLPTMARTLALLSAVLAAPAPAAEVYLRDGSVVIGTIESLTDGVDLTVDTAHMGDVVIEWDAIERIEGTAAVNVELFSGERLVGNLSLQGGQLYVGALDASDGRTIEPDEVFQINKYTDNWTDGLDADLTLGLNLVRGNNEVTQLSYGGGIAYDGNRFESGLDSTLIINEQTDAENTRRFTLRGFHNQKLSGNWTAGGIYQFESDDLQQLQGRSLLAAVLNNRVVNNRRHRLSLSGGLAVNAEDFESTSRSESVEAVLGAIYRLRSEGGVDLDATFYALPSLSESDRVRAQLDATVSADLFGDLDVRLIYFNRYDSDPPVAVSEFDYGLTLALGYEF